MRVFLLFFWLINAVAFAQPPSKAVLLKRKNQWVDSSLDKDGWKYFQDQYTNESSMGEGDDNQTFVPSLLQSGKDLFSSLTGFSFSIRRFRMKGLNNRYFSQSIHEISMNQLSDGNIPWINWGGLNEVTANNQYATGLKENEYQFGALGSAVFMQLNASKLFPQTTVTINFSNRNYHQRMAFTKVWLESKKGWSFATSFAYKYGEGGVMVANSFRGFSYFLSIDKRLKNQLWSLVIIGNRQFNTRTAAITSEMVRLSGAHFYQPGWGWQAGEIRNANGQFNHHPTLILSQEYQSLPAIKRVSTFMLSKGEKYNTGLDWYNATDPRPDYYRYLPSFFKDSVTANNIEEELALNPSQMQIDWERMYWVNQFSTIDKRARYLLEDRVEQSLKFSFNTRYQLQIGPHFKLNFQGQFKFERYEYFKRVNDLLGATYSINWNQFAEDNLPGSTAIQNDLNFPNQKIKEGDRFGYHYQMHLRQWLGMLQLSYSLPNLDLFSAFEYSTIHYQRQGLFKNGVFPLNSFGTSTPDQFKNVQFKMGATYKLNGRNYFYAHSAISSKPPLVNDLYISPRTNDLRQSTRANERALMLEAGYVLNAPLLKLRFNAYYIQIQHAMDVMSFYHDGYRNLVNYALSNIATLMQGLELSMAYSVSAGFTINTALALGKYVYKNRPQYSVLADNEQYVSEKGVLYVDQFPVTGLPQLAFYSGIAYRLNGNLFLNLSSSYMANQWLSFNPIRRTYDAAQNLLPDIDRRDISNPTAIPSAWVIDFSAGYSFRIKKFTHGHSYYLQCFLGVNNALNQPIITGGYEQLRFDSPGGDPNKFPNKFYFSQGILYSLSLKWKL